MKVWQEELGCSVQVSIQDRTVYLISDINGLERECVDTRGTDGLALLLKTDLF